MSRNKSDLLQSAHKDINLKTAKLYANNTLEYLLNNGNKCYQLHDTIILTITPENDYILNADNWKTLTTKSRLNELLGYGVIIFSEKGIWYLELNKSWDSFIFYNDITITKNGSGKWIIKDYHPPFNPDDIKVLRKNINKFAADFINEVIKGNVSKPDLGDCFYCQMRTVEDNIPAGEAFENPNHLLSHIEEKYYVPSLLYRAIEVNQLSPISNSYLHNKWFNDNGENYTCFEDIFRSQALSSLKKYLYRQFSLS